MWGVLLSIGSLVTCHQIAYASKPKLFAVENWNKESGPPLDLTWKAWRLVSVDLASGEETGISSWHGGHLPNRNDPNGRLIGATYRQETESRDAVLVDTDSGMLTCYTLAGGTCGSQQVAYSGAYFDETDGFFTIASMEDVEPQNTLFSVFDGFSLGSPSHYATINATSLVEWLAVAAVGQSVATQVTYVATSLFNGSSQLFRVERISGHVMQLPFRPSNANASDVFSIQALFARKLTSGKEGLLVLTCSSSGPPAFVTNCTLHEMDVASRASSVVLKIPHFDPGPAIAHCKSYHAPSDTLYLGCEKVVAINLGNATVSGITQVKLTKPKKFSGGDYSITGIAVVDTHDEEEPDIRDSVAVVV